MGRVARVGVVASFVSFSIIVFFWQRIFLFVPSNYVDDLLTKVAVTYWASLGLWFAMGRQRAAPEHAGAEEISDKLANGQLGFEAKDEAVAPNSPSLIAQTPKVTAYCGKERKSFEMKNPVQRLMKNGGAIIFGICSSCGCKVSRFGQLDGNGQASPSTNMVQIRLTRTHTGYVPLNKIQGLKLVDEKVEVLP